MNKHSVVSIHRDRWSRPKLTINIEARVPSVAAGERFIAEQVMAAYSKRIRAKLGRWASMRIVEFRVVDEQGLKRLMAAAKASVTIRRRLAAKKAAATRKRNLTLRQLAR